ncbi:hypothetical protein V2O64_06355 [Verrucomicrobiaceae bacterium 227]
MKPTLRSLLAPGSCLIALSVGLLIGRKTAPDPPAISLHPPASPTGARSPQVAAQSRSQPAHGGNARSASTAGSFSGSTEERKDEMLVALSDILNTSNRIERSRLLLGFLDKLESEDMENVITGFREAGWVDYNRGEYSMLISAWMDRDPYTAISFLDQNETDGWTRKTAISAWASENPDAAAEAIQELDDEGRVNDWVVGLIEGMARNDPAGALLTLQKLPPGDTRKQAIREMLPEVVIRGTEFAGEWIEQIDEPKLQSDTARNLAHSLARRDPESASDWIKGLTATETRRNASEVVSEVYASQDLDGARTWAESLPMDTLSGAAEGVAKHLTRRDPIEAAQWLQDLGTNPELDGARVEFLREAGKKDPQVALENIHNLSQPAQQERYYRDILKGWSKNDKEAAISWAIANSESIPETVLKSVVPKDRRPM